ncbi:X-ray radiation resistance-associated protein [Pimephales promelas]|nr:X-ray radiation resistance-associated protein [Pimephales promelas]
MLFVQVEIAGDLLEPFKRFPALRELELSLNSLHKFDIHAEEFQRLEIAEEEALLPVALFPKLNELVIHSNPLTTQRSGDPPMLTYFLQDKLGIKIRRKITTDRIKRHIKLPINPKRKVKTTIPNIPKFPSIMENQHATKPLCPKKYTGEESPQPSEYGLMHAFGLSSQTSIEDEEDIVMGQEHLDLPSADISFEANQDAEPFFVTEINGPNQSEYQEELDYPKPGNEIISSLEMKASKACPVKLIGYEILLDDTSEPEMPEISGIQHAVRILEHTLKNLLVYRDSKANLDLPQKPYAEREKRMSTELLLVCGHPLKPVEWKYILCIENLSAHYMLLTSTSPGYLLLGVQRGILWISVVQNRSGFAQSGPRHRHSGGLPEASTYRHYTSKELLKLLLKFFCSANIREGRDHAHGRHLEDAQAIDTGADVRSAGGTQGFRGSSPEENIARIQSVDWNAEQAKTIERVQY